MTENPTASDVQNNGFPANTDDPFVRLFRVGVMGWLVGMLILLGVGWKVVDSENASSAIVWAISKGWAGFLFGLLVLVGYGLVKRLPVATAAFAYALPGAVLALVSGVCLLVYPDSLLREELFTYLPVVFVFYVLGLVWIRMRGETRDSPVMARAVIPALLGGLVILGLVAVPVFASDAFRYRDAFVLTLNESTAKDGVLAIECTIEVRKPGNYSYSAPRYAWSDISETEADSDVEFGEFQWGEAGAPQPGVLGVFPVRISWKKGVLMSQDLENMFYDDYISIEVRNADEGEHVVHSMTSPLVIR